MHGLLVTMVAMIVLCGCAAPADRPAETGPLDRMKVVSQVCFDIGTPLDQQWIQHSAISREMHAGGAMTRVGTTSAGQAIFERVALEPASLQAVLVTVRPIASETAFFLAPASYTASWSAWREADGVTSDRTADAFLFRNRLNELRPTRPDTPKIRYRTLAFGSYLRGVGQRGDVGPSRDFPPC